MILARLNRPCDMPLIIRTHLPGVNPRPVSLRPELTGSQSPVWDRSIQAHRLQPVGFRDSKTNSSAIAT